MSPAITRNVLSGPRPSGLPIARAKAPHLTESHEDPPEGPESHEPESCLDQMIADLGPASSYRPPHLQRQDRPPASHFHPSRALPAKPAPKPLSRRKVEPPPPVEGALMTCKEVAGRLRISEKALEHLRRRGTGPKHVSIGRTGRSVRYRRDDVDAYIAGLADQGGH
jgi:hypothetical protein